MLDRTRFTRLLDAAEEAGVPPHTLVDHALAGRLELTNWADDIEYREVVTSVVSTNGARERLPMPPHFVPEGGSPTVPAGPYGLSPGAASRAVNLGREEVHALADFDGDVYRLASPLPVTPSDVLIKTEDWEAFKKEHREELRAQKKARASARSTPGNSKRDAERLSLGSDALLTLRRAAELLPGDDKANRHKLLEGGIARVVHEADEGGNGRKRTVQMVRWGDVFDLFPTAREAEEAERLALEDNGWKTTASNARRRRKPRPPSTDFRLADL